MENSVLYGGGGGTTPGAGCDSATNSSCNLSPVSSNSFSFEATAVNTTEAAVDLNAFSTSTSSSSDGGFFTAAMCCSTPKPPPGSPESTLPDLSPYLQQMAELIRQLQSLEEEESALIQEVLDSDVDVDKLIKAERSYNPVVKSGLIVKKRKKPVPDVVGALSAKREQTAEATRETLGVIRKARRDLGRCLTSRVYARALKFATTVSPAPSITTLQSEDNLLTFLSGRCFNLSLNLKILKDSEYHDYAIAGRCYSDLSVLEDRLEHYISDGDVLLRLQAAKTKRQTNAAATEVERNFTNALRLKPVRKLLRLSNFVKP